MTLEKLLGGSADYLESLTDEELREFFKPYIPTCRPTPEQEKLKRAAPSTKNATAEKKRSAEQKLAELMRKFEAGTGQRLNL